MPDDEPLVVVNGKLLDFDMVDKFYRGILTADSITFADNIPVTMNFGDKVGKVTEIEKREDGIYATIELNNVKPEFVKMMVGTGMHLSPDFSIDEVQVGFHPGNPPADGFQWHDVSSDSKEDYAPVSYAGEHLVSNGPIHFKMQGKEDHG